MFRKGTLAMAVATLWVVLADGALGQCGGIVVMRQKTFPGPKIWLRQSNTTPGCSPGWNDIPGEVEVSASTVTFQPGVVDYEPEARNTEYRIYCQATQDVTVRSVTSVGNKDLHLTFMHEDCCTAVTISNLDVDLRHFRTSQIGTWSNITGNVTYMRVVGFPGSGIANAGRCELRVGGSVLGSMSSYDYELDVIGSVSAPITCTNMLLGNIDVAGDLLDTIEITNGYSLNLRVPSSGLLPALRLCDLHGEL